MSIDILSPIIRELEQLARTHPDPSVRANILHVIDVLTKAGDDELLSVMHQFYHLREQLREEEELRRLHASDAEYPPMEFSTPPPYNPNPAEYTISNDLSTEGVFYQMFADTDEDEFDELVEAQHTWGIPVGEA